ncbi:ABC transporter substrate-binding protein [Nitratireductor kimnyeongensis]|uniref:ABC transporter substrate-binding protein n=1 Tax=Nitratireductor kimnyeongensis TaxID=430679 RepID=A0ABW0TAE3_9HYPH|nr:ABC transporter substrate-binding protein [Nitratireductor kimnyeongensis]QZZ35994.1 ABC transporter substrate-binding protein [Nitratireductor kimnyeongensis]
MLKRRKRLPRLSGLVLLVGALLVVPVSASPKRVMSLNLCTDQLAMTLAEPDQLVSVSFLAREPSLSMLHEKAQRYPVNHGLAEEVFLENPDLIVTGTYSLHNTTAMLKRLGFHVEEFSFAQTLETIPGEVRRMGALIGQEKRAETIADDFTRELEAIAAGQCGKAPTMIAYDQNGIASGRGTLADSVIRAAGFANLAAEMDIVGVAPFPLEQVITAQPDVINVNVGHTAPTLGEYVPRHPAIAALPDTRIGAFVPEGSLSCGTPSVIEAVRALVALRAEIAPCPGSATQ